MASDEARGAAAAYLRANATNKRHGDDIVFAKLLAGEMDELPIIQSFDAFEQQIVERCAGAAVRHVPIGNNGTEWAVSALTALEIADAITLLAGDVATVDNSNRDAPPANP